MGYREPVNERAGYKERGWRKSGWGSYRCRYRKAFQRREDTAYTCIKAYLAFCGAGRYTMDAGSDGTPDKSMECRLSSSAGNGKGCIQQEPGHPYKIIERGKATYPEGIGIGIPAGRDPD